MKKCDSYHLQPKTRYTYHPLTGRCITNDIEVGVCWGTKERDECVCGGDRTKCDFYPWVREKAKDEAAEILTNADRIRTMTDEELADFLVFKLPEGDSDWPDLMLKWLKEPFMREERTDGGNQ